MCCHTCDCGSRQVRRFFFCLDISGLAAHMLTPPITLSPVRLKVSPGNVADQSGDTCKTHAHAVNTCTKLLNVFSNPCLLWQLTNHLSPVPRSQPMLCTAFPIILSGWRTSVLSVANVSSTVLRSVCHLYVKNQLSNQGRYVYSCTVRLEGLLKMSTAVPR